MISSEPDPGRNPIPTLARPIISINWTPEARREYSRCASEKPTRAALNALAKRAIFQTLQDAPRKLEALADLKKPTFSLDVSFVGDGEIQELNSHHRSKNKPTDVLSFSQLEGEWMPIESFAGGEEILLGDLIISIETAVRQAGELKHDLSHEIAFLTSHGVLHLLGYDHDTSSRRRAMFALQDKIVERLETPTENRKATPRKPSLAAS